MTDPDESQPTDRELLAAHLAGDDQAFGDLFARHRDRLWAVALRTTQNREDAADALQDAMISAFRRADSFRGDSAVTTWLHRIVVNACLDRLRRAKVRSAESLDDRWGTDRPTESEDLSTRQLAGGQPTETDPARAAELTLTREAVLAGLRKLPPDQCAAIVLVDIEGHSVAEAGEILDCPPGTVKSRCARGRARLAELLGHLSEGTGPPGAASNSQPAPVSNGTTTRPREGGAR